MTDHDHLAALYKAVFEDDKRGQTLLEDLQRKFCKRPDPNDFSPEAMLRGFVRTHQREVVEYMVRQINRANGAEEPPEGEAP